MMNYFRLFEIPETFITDKALLRERFLKMSRASHPDFVAREDEYAQQEALESSALVNEAYKVLNDDDARMSYLLELKEIIQPDEKFNLPGGFLMEMMEVNENLQEANAEGNLIIQEEVLQTIAKEKKRLQEVLGSLLQQEEEGPLSNVQKEQIKLVYYQKKYLQRILDTGTNAANIASH